MKRTGHKHSKTEEASGNTSYGRTRVQEETHRVSIGRGSRLKRENELSRYSFILAVARLSYTDETRTPSSRTNLRVLFSFLSENMKPGKCSRRKDSGLRLTEEDIHSCSSTGPVNDFFRVNIYSCHQYENGPSRSASPYSHRPERHEL